MRGAATSRSSFSESAALRWIAVRTKPLRERLTASHLQQRDVEPYCPLYQEPRWHPRSPKGPVPLFAGYIFVRCRPCWHLTAVEFCPGVLRAVRFGGVLAVVDDELISELRLREGERGYIVPLEEEEGIRNGQPVRVMAGPMKGLEGVFRGYLKGGQRAWVLLEFLRARTRVEVDTDALAIVHR